MSRPRTGDPDCKICGGSGGVIRYSKNGGPPEWDDCLCRIKMDIEENMERAWRGLSKAKKSQKNLLRYIDENLWITASSEKLRSLLKTTAIHMGSKWSFKVITDADLMVSWLSNIDEVLDADVAAQREYREEARYLTAPTKIFNRVAPYQNLLIILGVKAARNSAMPEVLKEALTTRQHLGKVTWISDQPYRKLDSTHLCYSEEIDIYLTHEWLHKRASASDREVKKTSQVKKKAQPSSSGLLVMSPSDGKSGYSRYDFGTNTSKKRRW